MYVMYYYESDFKTKGWKRGSKEALENFAKENNIIEYEIAVDEMDYDRLLDDLKTTQRQVNAIKASVEDAMNNITKKGKYYGI